MVTLSTDAFPVATFTAMGAPPMSASNWHCARVRAFAWLYCRDDHSRLAVARSTENTNRNTAEYRAPRVMGRRRRGLPTVGPLAQQLPVHCLQPVIGRRAMPAPAVPLAAVVPADRQLVVSQVRAPRDDLEDPVLAGVRAVSGRDAPALALWVVREPAQVARVVERDASHRSPAAPPRRHRRPPARTQAAAAQAAATAARKTHRDARRAAPRPGRPRTAP